ncbi:MAG TPA: MFS transporter [Pseudolabrys sp.]|jgi:MFS family permease|nr:MFS transporter [Pseudolabrys sp.]
MTDIAIDSMRLTKQRPFVLLCIARLFSTLGYQALTVAIGWSIYDITHNAFDLGLVGLIQFLPAVVFTLAIGHIADRYDRRLIVRIAQAVSAIAAITVFVALVTQMFSLALLFGAVFLVGCARAFEVPTAHALMPVLVSPQLLPRAVAGWNTANQTAVICGPALGGFIYAVSPPLVCIVCLVFFVTAITLVTLVKVDRPAPRREPPTLKSVLAGIGFVRSRSRLLGVISLDLFVTLLGGVTALLPIYASDILNAGPTGLGLLRSAPAIGALSTSIVLARFPVESRIGIKMFSVVALYGLATMVFSVSTSLTLSMIALAVLGASDSISVVIRFSLVQIETPDAMRGRVTAINSLFVGTSNTLGEFESGMLAGFIGAMPAAFIGGLGSLLVAGLWMWLFPDLRRVDRYQPANDGPRV